MQEFPSDLTASQVWNGVQIDVCARFREHVNSLVRAAAQHRHEYVEIGPLPTMVSEETRQELFEELYEAFPHLEVRDEIRLPLLGVKLCDGWSWSPCTIAPEGEQPLRIPIRYQKSPATETQSDSI